MFGLPKSTEIKIRVDKKQIYQRFAAELNGDKRKKFDEDIGRIVVTNEISEASVNVKATDTVSSIFVVKVEVKSKDYSDRNIVLISKLFGQNLLLALHYQREYQLAIYENILHKTDWKQEEMINLHLQGLDMQGVWDSFVMQVSGIQVEAGNTLAEQISKDIQKEKLMKQIEDLESKARKEPQAKKKFELFQKMNKLKRVLEEES